MTAFFAFAESSPWLAFACIWVLGLLAVSLGQIARRTRVTHIHHHYRGARRRTTPEESAGRPSETGTD